MLYTFKCVSKHNTIRRFYINIFKFLICILHLPLNLENYIWVVKFEKLYFYFGYEIFILDVENVHYLLYLLYKEISWMKGVVFTVLKKSSERIVHIKYLKSESTRVILAMERGWWSLPSFCPICQKYR